MKKPSKLLAALTAAGIVAGGGSAMAHHKGGHSFDSAASKFKEPGDKGRPDLFGPPGRPVIGPPGQYAG